MFSYYNSIISHKKEKEKAVIYLRCSKDKEDDSYFSPLHAAYSLKLRSYRSDLIILTRTFLSFPGQTWFAAKANSVQAQGALDDMV